MENQASSSMNDAAMLEKKRIINIRDFSFVRGCVEV